MSYRLPPNIEENVQRFAHEQHLSHDDAVLKLIETSLQHSRTHAKVEGEKNAAEELIGLFSSPEEVALIDEVVAMAYEGRKAAAVRKRAV